MADFVGWCYEFGEFGHGVAYDRRSLSQSEK